MKLVLDDFRVNEDKLSLFVVLVYRFGNWIHYHVHAPIIRRLLQVCYKTLNICVRLSTGSEIPATCKIGKRLRLEHGGNGVVIHAKSIIGDNARIFHQVTLGINTFDRDNYGAPVIGDNVYIGCGVKIIGHVRIGDNVRIGANAVVTKDIPSNCTAVGIPAKPVERSKVVI